MNTDSYYAKANAADSAMEKLKDKMQSDFQKRGGWTITSVSHHMLQSADGYYHASAVIIWNLNDDFDA